MQKPGIPSNDTARLAALRCTGLLDTAPSESFDRVTQLAAQLLDVPIALVSLVDESRQWFKSRVGLEASETSRDVSFCAHAIFNDAPLLVNDAYRDARFADNPLVVGAPRLQAYLGVPLHTREGHAIGTLCALDTRPRDFDEADTATLAKLAKILEDAIQAQELATATATLLASATRREEMFRDTFEQAAVGFVHSNLSGDILRLNKRCCEMLGYEASELANLSFIDITHVDDVARSVELFQKMIGGESDSYELDKRYVRKDETICWAHLSVTLKRSPSGHADYIITVIEDIGARKQAEEELSMARHSLQAEVTEQTDRLRRNNIELRAYVKRLMESERSVRRIEHRLRSIADNVPALIGYWSGELRCEFANDAYRGMFGLDPQTIVGMSMLELLGETRFGAVEPHIRLVLAGEAQRFERPSIRFDGVECYVETRYIPDLNESMTVRGFFVLETEITEARNARLALEAANAKLTSESAIDHLSGLSNRRVFTERSENAARHFKKNDEVYGLILMDLDDFRQINDIHGHDVGDEVLQTVGRVLKSQLRSHRDVAARLGGEEFAMLCFGDLDEDLMRLIAERVRFQLNGEMVKSESGDLKFTASFGFAISDAADAGWKDMYARADGALHQAKSSGKDRVEFGAGDIPATDSFRALRDGTARQ